MSSLFSRIKPDRQVHGTADLFSYTTRTIFVGPLSIGLLAMIMLWQPAQSREIYLGIVSDRDYLRGVLGLLGVLWLSAALYAWNARLVNARIDELYPSHGRLMIDYRLKAVRNFKEMLCAILPLAGLFLGLLSMWPTAIQASLLIGKSDLALAERLDAIPLAAAVWACLVALSGWAVLTALRASRSTRLIDASAMIIGVLIYTTPLVLGIDAVVGLARSTGPLWTVALVGLALIPTVRTLIYLYRGLFGFIVGVVLLMAPMFDRSRLVWLQTALALAAVAAVVVNLRQPPGINLSLLQPPLATEAPEGLKPEFDRWLAARGIAAPSGEITITPPAPGRKFPVFVVAAQGGGIYAASSALTLLSKLQDRCPNFAQHIFAISAVSGGAIGATIFQSLLPDRPVEDRCDIGTKSVLSDASARIMTDDHISTLVATTPSDWLAKLNLVGYATDRRSEALTRSFVRSFQDAMPAPQDRGKLSRNAHTYWKADAPAPALVLASTSVETGQRVAFSPLSLARIGDGTVQSFADLVATPANPRGLTLALESKAPFDELTLIDAAVTSARFPGLLPAWPLLHTVQRGAPARASKLRLNFVDGGYADASGASTAAEIMTALEQIVSARRLGDAVSLHLILLTDTETSAPLETADGTDFSDVIAPINTLLSVRQLLARSAVTRAVKELEKQAQTNSSVEIGVLRIAIDRRMFPLPLGWSLSKTTNDLIVAMLGSERGCVPELLEAPGPSEGSGTDTELRAIQPTLFERFRNKNSCEQARIVRLLQR